MSRFTFMLRALLHAIPGILLASCAGNINDTLEEARRGDPESIRRSVVEIGNLLAQKEASNNPYDEGDAAAINFLRDVAEKSPDSLNRASAIDSLSRLKRLDMSQLYVTSLEDKTWIVQLESARALQAQPRPSAAEPLAQRLEADLRLEVRLEILKALQAVGGERALRALLEAFLDTSPRYENIRLATYDGVRALSGKNYPLEDTVSWQTFHEERFPTERPPGDPGTKPLEGGARETPAGAPASGRVDLERARPGEK
jgi:HEAT repeat protein